MSNFKIFVKESNTISMKKLLVLALGIFCLCGYSKAQQGVQYTQFMFNKLVLNPAYATTAQHVTVAGLCRTQWVGIEGAPISQSINAMIPLKSKKVAFGVSLDYDKIGPSRSFFYRAMYSYGFKIGKGKLGVGLQAAIRSYRVDWDELDATQSNDELLLNGQSNKTLPNIGAGLYYQTDKFYVGFSMPTLIRGDLSGFNYELNGNSDYGREERHTYIMAGYLFTINDKLKVKPAILAKHVTNAPFDIDLHASLIILNKFWAGLTYRLGGLESGAGESLGLIFQYQIMRSLRAGISYDYSLSAVQKQHSGTYELAIEYTFSPKSDELTNPRHF